MAPRSPLNTRSHSCRMQQRCTSPCKEPRRAASAQDFQMSGSDVGQHSLSSPQLPTHKFIQPVERNLVVVAIAVMLVVCGAGGMMTGSQAENFTSSYSYGSCYASGCVCVLLGVVGLYTGLDKSRRVGRGLSLTIGLVAGVVCVIAIVIDAGGMVSVFHYNGCYAFDPVSSSLASSSKPPMFTRSVVDDCCVDKRSFGWHGMQGSCVAQPNAPQTNKCFCCAGAHGHWFNDVRGSCGAIPSVFHHLLFLGVVTSFMNCALVVALWVTVYWHHSPARVVDRAPGSKLLPF